MGRGSDGACLLVFLEFTEDRSRRQCQRGKSQQHQKQDLQTNDEVRLEAFDANCLIGKQLLRSGTSVGANINEAIYGNSKADFISKLHISLKETGESIYWLTLLKRTNLIEYNFDELLSLAEEIKRMLIASLNTAKENK